jgi:hypothetical protein
MKKIVTLIKNIFKKRVTIILPELIHIQQAILPAVICPFNGEKIPFILKELNDVEIKSCGNFSLINSFSVNIVKNSSPTISEMVEFSEIQHNICKISMISPSYDDVLSIYDETESVKKFREQLKEIEIKLAEIEINGISNKKEYSELMARYSSLKILSNLVLPNDFTSFVTEYAIGVNKTDIKKVTYDMLLEAAILAENGHNNPSDHLSGVFSDFNKGDINNRAWSILFEYRKCHNGRS